MRKHVGFVLLLVSGITAISEARADQPAAEKAGAAVSFSLKDVGGRDVALTDFRDKKAIVVVFIGTECPVNTYYMPRLKELQSKYAAMGVQFLAINSNPQDTVADVAEHAKQERIAFPVL